MAGSWSCWGSWWSSRAWGLGFWWFGGAADGCAKSTKPAPDAGGGKRGGVAGTFRGHAVAAPWAGSTGSAASPSSGSVHGAAVEDVVSEDVTSRRRAPPKVSSSTHRASVQLRQPHPGVEEHDDGGVVRSTKPVPVQTLSRSRASAVGSTSRAVRARQALHGVMGERSRSCSAIAHVKNCCSAR